MKLGERRFDRFTSRWQLLLHKQATTRFVSLTFKSPLPGLAPLALLLQASSVATHHSLVLRPQSSCRLTNRSDGHASQPTPIRR